MNDAAITGFWCLVAGAISIHVGSLGWNTEAWIGGALSIAMAALVVVSLVLQNELEQP